MSLPSYTLTCTKCNYRSSYGYNVWYEYSEGRDALCQPEITQCWCYDCNQLRTIYLPKLGRKFSDPIERIDYQINSLSKGSISKFRLALSSDKKKQLDELYREKEKTLSEIKRCEAFFHDQGFAPKCLTCSSEKVVKVNIPDRPDDTSHLGILHVCGGQIMIQETLRISYASCPKVVYDIAGNILLDEREKEEQEEDDSSDQTGFTLVWQECSKNSSISKRFHVPSFEGHLPFLVYGSDYNALQNKEKFQVTEKNLLLGILYGLYEIEESPKPWIDLKNIDTFLHLLDVLGQGFKFTDPEQMILDVASMAREEIGSNVSYKILRTGGNLIPNSSKIKSDLIMDTWIYVSDYDNDYDELEKIVPLIKQLDLQTILPDVKELICYYGLCSLVLLEDEAEINAFLEEYVYPNVNHRKLKENIKNLLENPFEFEPADLTIRT